MPGLQLVFIVVLCVSLATIREGSEVIIFIIGFSDSPMLQPVLIGSAIGAGIGLSLGVLIYYGLVNLPERYVLTIVLLLLILIGVGMMSQAIQLLHQADVISESYRVWDSSGLVDERSLLGQLLYALIGYESTPTLTQTIAYLASLMVSIYLAAMTLKNRKNDEKK